MKNVLVLAVSALLVILTFKSCTTIPKGAVAVKSFEIEKYLGRWYEIARMDFRFERNLDNTTAEYSLNSNGSIKVDNRGRNYVTGKWSQAIGKAKPAGEPDEARLKVSFFGPFYAAYNVIALDNDYQYALVAGKNLSYLWILSRQTVIPDEVKQMYLKKSQDLGFDTSALIWVNHDKNQENSIKK